MSTISPQGYVLGDSPESTNPFWNDFNGDVSVGAVSMTSTNTSTGTDYALTQADVGTIGTISVPYGVTLGLTTEVQSDGDVQYTITSTKNNVTTTVGTFVIPKYDDNVGVTDISMTSTDSTSNTTYAISFVIDGVTKQLGSIVIPKYDIPENTDTITTVSMSTTESDSETTYTLKQDIGGTTTTIGDIVVPDASEPSPSGDYVSNVVMTPSESNGDSLYTFSQTINGNTSEVGTVTVPGSTTLTLTQEPTSDGTDYTIISTAPNGNQTTIGSFTIPKYETVDTSNLIDSITISETAENDATVYNVLYYKGDTEYNAGSITVSTSSGGDGGSGIQSISLSADPSEDESETTYTLSYVDADGVTQTAGTFTVIAQVTSDIPDGDEDGQVPVWDSTSNSWVPETLEGMPDVYYSTKSYANGIPVFYQGVWTVAGNSYVKSNSISVLTPSAYPAIVAISSTGLYYVNPHWECNSTTIYTNTLSTTVIKNGEQSTVTLTVGAIPTYINVGSTSAGYVSMYGSYAYANELDFAVEDDTLKLTIGITSGVCYPTTTKSSTASSSLIGAKNLVTLTTSISIPLSDLADGLKPHSGYTKVTTADQAWSARFTPGESSISNSDGSLVWNIGTDTITLNKVKDNVFASNTILSGEEPENGGYPGFIQCVHDADSDTDSFMLVCSGTEYGAMTTVPITGQITYYEYVNGD